VSRLLSPWNISNAAVKLPGGAKLPRQRGQENVDLLDGTMKASVDVGGIKLPLGDVRARPPDPHRTAIRSLQQWASAETAAYFAIEPDGSFSINTLTVGGRN
jgi:hypothetical protein